MANALYTAATGLNASKEALASESNDLANVKTNGYKSFRPVFIDLAYQNETRIGQEDQEVGIMQFGLGTAVVNNVGDFKQGDLEHVEDKFSIAIQGNGFLVIQMPDDSFAYTRDGKLALNANGELVHAATGYVVNQTAVNIPADFRETMNISEDGSVTVQDGEGNQVEIGRFELARFINPSGLERLGENLYIQTEASGEPEVNYPMTDSMGKLKQGFLERSNVNPVQSIINITEIQHWYNYNLTAMKAASEMENKLTNTTA